MQNQKLKGVEFVVDAEGKQKAVIIDLKHHRELWEDFYDIAIAKSRKREPRERLDLVKRKVLGSA